MNKNLKKMYLRHRQVAKAKSYYDTQKIQLIYGFVLKSPYYDFQKYWKKHVPYYDAWKYWKKHVFKT